MNASSTYLHARRLTARSPRWELGGRLEFGRELNFYTRQLEESVPTLRLASGTTVKAAEAIKQLVATRLHQMPLGNIDLFEYHFDPLRAAGEAAALLDFESRRIRELILEQERLRRFGHLPSRRTCIWLLPNERTALVKWIQHSLPTGSIVVYEISVEGRIHRGDSRLLRLSHKPTLNIRGDAENYWTSAGLDEAEAKPELIAEGSVTILRECATISSDQTVNWISP